MEEEEFHGGGVQSMLSFRAARQFKTPMQGKTEGERRKGQLRMRWLNSITHSMDTNLSKLWGVVEDSGAQPAAVHGVKKSQTWLSGSITTSVQTQPKQIQRKRHGIGYW